MQKVVALVLFMFVFAPFSVQATPIYEDFSSIDKNWRESAVRSIPEVKEKYLATIREAAWKHDISPDFITAILVVESLGEADAISSAGAQGCMQLMPAALKEIGHAGNPLICRENIKSAVAYLARLRSHYGYGEPEMMALAYHYGPSGAQGAENVLEHDYVKRMYFVLSNL